MKLSEIILENEHNKQTHKSRELVRIRLKELVYAFPNEVLQVLHKTGIAVSTLLPSSVLYAVVIKHVQINSELREAISKMLLELDSYASADGQNWQIAGGIASAVGSVLMGIGRSQTEQTQSISQAQENEYQKNLENEKAKGNRRAWLIGGISLMVIIGLILLFKVYGKAPVKTSTGNLQVS